ncbi:MAG TPA: TlpA disulfide reductase family protein, partial [Flavisolibacter sp.]|nr:TlpA disulfide reductase family protein [Flavisolibacter sp.]
MRLLCFIILVLVSFKGMAQTRIQLILKNGQGLESFDAFDLSQKEKQQLPYKDTIEVTFQKNQIDCYNIRYHGQGKIYREQVWLNPGSVTIYAHISGEELKVDTILNAPVYYQAADFAKAFGAYKTAKDTMGANTYALNVFKENRDNPFSLLAGYYYLMLNQNSRTALYQLRTLLQEQQGRFSWFFFYSLIEDRLQAVLNADPVQLSDFRFFNRSGQSVQPSLPPADRYILDFWFTSCAPCLREHQEIAAHLERLKENKVAVIGIATDEQQETWSRFVKKKAYQWQQYREDPSQSFTRKLGIRAFPNYAILDAKGDIVGMYSSFTDVLHALQID